MSDLPSTWTTSRLGDLCTIKTGKRDVNEGASDGKYPFFTCAQQVYRINSCPFDGESILVAGNGFFNVKYFNGKFDAYQRTYVLQDFAIDGKYLFRYIQYKLDDITKDNRGSTVNYIRLGDLSEHIVPVAPSGEQSRIVAKLESLLSKVESSHKRLRKIPVILKRFRQSVLAAACSGRLSVDWRERNPSDKSVEEIVEALRSRREVDIKSEIEKEKIRQIFSRPEENDSGELPESWRFIALRKLCVSFEYGTSAKSQSSGNVPVLRMGNIQDGEIDWADLVYTSNKEEIQKYLLRPNTVLFNRTNSPELVGKTAIYRGERPAIFAGYLIRVNQFPELDPEYLNICLNTNYAKEFRLHVKTDGVSQSNINAQKLSTFEVPFCSLAEQQEIVRRVQKLFVLANKIEGRYTKAQAHTEKLEQSILAKAFRGELVAQDPNDDSKVG